MEYQPALTKVEFLGHSILAHRGTAWLHRKTGAPIVPVLMVEDRESYQKLIIDPALELSHEQKIDDDVRAIYRQLEMYVSQYPTQWRYWKLLHKMSWSEPKADNPAQTAMKEMHA